MHVHVIDANVHFDFPLCVTIVLDLGVDTDKRDQRESVIDTRMIIELPVSKGGTGRKADIQHIIARPLIRER